MYLSVMGEYICLSIVATQRGLLYYKYLDTAKSISHIFQLIFPNKKQHNSQPFAHKQCHIIIDGIILYFKFIYP